MKRLFVFEAGITAVFTATYILCNQLAVKAGDGVVLALSAPLLLVVLCTRRDEETNKFTVWPLAVLVASYCFALAVCIAKYIPVALAHRSESYTLFIFVISIIVLVIIALFSAVIVVVGMRLKLSSVLPSLLVNGIVILLILFRY